MVAEVFQPVRSEAGAQTPPGVCRVPGGRVPRRGKQDTVLSGLSRSAVGNELVEVVDGAALAPVAAANPQAVMMPGAI